MTDSVVKLLERDGLISVANTKPRGRAELSLTDAGWDALAKTRAFYATERFETHYQRGRDGDGRTNGKRANRQSRIASKTTHVRSGISSTQYDSR